MSRIKIFNAKRCVAVFMAMLITVLSLSYANNNRANATDTNSDIKYYVYNAQTGVKIPNRDYTLSKLSSSNNTRAVIGEDQRYVDWTKSGVVKIITDYDEEYYKMSSGFVVSDHVIATAAHCVYNQKISKILLFDSNGKEVMNATPVEYHVPVDFINALSENDNKYTPTSDYALITVSDNLESFNNFKLGVTLKSFDKSYSTVNVTGFPKTIGKPGKEIYVNDDTKHFMYTGGGLIKSNEYVDDKLMTYVADMSGGDSGGPVYIIESLNDEKYYTVVGINIAEPYVEKPLYNIGTRMTTDLIHFYT
ncbi:MAG: trypsin-like serine protease, partial [Ruminococcus sp.]|nr:trypsin-like serine protease [Ruminococcus sp.]